MHETACFLDLHAASVGLGCTSTALSIGAGSVTWGRQTTQVSLALLDGPWLHGRSIIVLEPRRVAARSAPMFMARQLGEEVGGIAG